MSEKIKIWLVGNTGLRNPNRIQEGFAAYAGSPFVGNLREENEVAFMNFLNELRCKLRTSHFSTNLQFR